MPGYDSWKTRSPDDEEYHGLPWGDDEPEPDEEEEAMTDREVMGTPEAAAGAYTTEDVAAWIREIQEVFEAAKKWHGFQSMENTSTLYNALSRVLKSKFDPAEYDSVE